MPTVQHSRAGSRNSTNLRLSPGYLVRPYLKKRKGENGDLRHDIGIGA